jgi:hypothetical protein
LGLAHFDLVFVEDLKIFRDIVPSAKFLLAISALLEPG